LGYGELVSKVKEHSASYSNIHYLPPVAHNEVVKIAKSADIGLAMIEAVSLSDYYCLPNKLFEYAFSGLFVITSDFPDMKRVVEEYDLGVTCAVDIDALRDLIKKLSNLECTERKKDLYKLSWQYQEEVLLQSYHKILTL
jgi:glycosyltransferase involved in cell wall biosynthesis